jgi:hypothetical protein
MKMEEKREAGGIYRFVYVRSRKGQVKPVIWKEVTNICAFMLVGLSSIILSYQEASNCKRD